MYCYKNDIEIIEEVDVAVAGAGPAGICAAVSAALSIKENITLRNLQTSKIRNVLTSKGVEL